MSEPIAFIDVDATEDLLLMGEKTKYKTLVVMQAGNLEPKPLQKEKTNKADNYAGTKQTCNTCGKSQSK